MSSRASTSQPSTSQASEQVAVIGAGTMGAGIAQVAALAGHPVQVHDTRPGAAEHAVRTAAQGIRRLAKRELVSIAEAESAGQRLSVAHGIEQLGGCMLVVEAIAEDLAAKRDLFRAVEEVVDDEVLLATNTSSLSVTALGAALVRPERLVGLHFFNPAYRMRLVEVVRGERSGPAYVELAVNLMRAWGQTPVLCSSTPGFIVNRVARPFYGEAHRLVEDRVSDPATVDAVLREGGGFPLGPLELSDLIGQDVNLAVARSVWEQTFHDPRYAPTVWQQRLVDAGRLGRKTGRGVYAYDPVGGHASATVALDPSRREPAAPGTAPRHQAPPYVGYLAGWSVLTPVLGRALAGGVEIRRDPPAGELPWAPDACPQQGGVCLPSGGRLLETTGATATSIGGDVVAVDWVGDAETAARVAVAPGAGARAESTAQAIGFLQAAGFAVSVVADGPGLVVARTVAMLVNEAADVVHRGEASAADVDLAMRLGTGYPRGPLEWGDAVGAARVISVLRALHESVPTGRYRVGRGLQVAADQGALLHG
jgi:3-hydroxybutyryl-CoA dehydrogenase